MRNAMPRRVHYFERQYLRRDDFADEQSYQIALRRRHNSTAHSWGIVAGLELALENDGIVVNPGIAVDGYGRELVLVSKRAIRTEEFQRLGSNRLDVWLYYESSPSDSTGQPVGSCDDKDSRSYYRDSETPRIVLERARVSRIISSRSKGVPDAILNAPAQLATPDDPLTIWPVYLGRLTYQPENQDPQKQLLVDLSDRHYAGVLAETVDHPDVATRVQVGAVQNGQQRTVGKIKYTYNTKSRQEFAVFVPRNDEDTGFDEVTLDPRFAIGEKDNTLRGTTTVYGNLQLPGGAVQFAKPVGEFPDPIKYSSIYRAAESGADELRIDLGALDETADPKKFVIGFTTEDGTFKPFVTLEYKSPAPGRDPQPLLTIEGDLSLKGLVNSKDLIQRSLSQDTLNALLASFQAGTIAAGGN